MPNHRTRSVLGLTLLLAGCVAPEAPPPPRYVPPAMTQSTGSLEAAPTPNRGVSQPTGNEVIRMAH